MKVSKNFNKKCFLLSLNKIQNFFGILGLSYERLQQNILQLYHRTACILLAYSNFENDHYVDCLNAVLFIRAHFVFIAINL